MASELERGKTEPFLESLATNILALGTRTFVINVEKLNLTRGFLKSLLAVPRHVLNANKSR